MKSRNIVLITDFGVDDYFVGAIKGVIGKINPHCHVVDLTHGIPSFQVLPAAFVLEKNLNYFPAGTIFLAVVDPGVGSGRNILLMNFCHYWLVGPDNGLFTPFLIQEEKEVWQAGQDLPIYLSKHSTFEARDKMAPLVAQLSLDIPVKDMAKKTSEYVILNQFFPTISSYSIKGQVIYIDTFGNLITNISAAILSTWLEEKDKKNLRLEISGQIITQFNQAYIDGDDKPMLLIGSHQNLEIALKQGSAAKYLQAALYQPVKVSL